MKVSRVQAITLLSIPLSLSACGAYGGKPRDEPLRVQVTTLRPKAVTITHQYVCQIKSHHRIEVRSPEAGYLSEVRVSEGQAVKRGDPLFRIGPPGGEKKLDAENKGNEDTGKAPFDIKAPFDGVVGRLPHQRDGLVRVRKDEALATLSDNSQMWVYFNVPEARYLEYKSANPGQPKGDPKIELVLANGRKFDQPGQLGAVGAVFSAGSVAFRADFPNPERLLRHGQTATVLISQVRDDSIVVPQWATLAALDKRYVYVVDKDDVARQREIVVQNELGDTLVVKTGVGAGDKIVTEGARLVRDGGKVTYEGSRLKKVVAGLK